MLPHFISAIQSADPNLSCNIIIQYLSTLVLASVSVKAREQFHAIVSCVAKQLELHMKVGKFGTQGQDSVEQ